ncbi:MAG: PAS domain-containing protein [Edaphobacter sp.]|uniref:PAS domain-containing protein n=1 Tax=Edaphobacter sp. TaxID=1934404 RepID=UPI0023A27F9F|nr:PAS domain-containing protein [Edaphobacter sp.]MDE1177057.1 PAS domain-containing protein [Edaphobacter sp.]
MPHPESNPPAGSPTDSSTHPRSGRRVDDLRNERLVGVLALIPDGVICLDREWRLTYANAAGRRLSQIESHHLEGLPIWDIFPENVGTPLHRAYCEVMETRVLTRLEHYSKRFDIWLDIQVMPVEDGICVVYRDITDRKGAELLRDAATWQLRQVLDTTTDAVVSLNREYRFTYLNRRARELLSIKGDLIGKNLWDEFPFAREHGLYRYHYARAMDEGIPGEFEDFYPEPLNIYLSIQVLPFEEGVVIFFRDITARRQSDHVLHLQQQVLSAVQQLAHVATWEADLATRQIIFGADSYPVFGHPFKELRTIDDLRRYTPAEYLPAIIERIRSSKDTGEMVVVDAPILAADGGLIWIESRIQVTYAEGIPRRLRGLSIDVTDRKRQEQALSASEARYRTLAELNPQAIWSSDADGQPTYANQGLLDYLGITEDELLRADWSQMFHAEDRDRVREAWSRSVSMGQDLDIEARMIRATDGRSRWWWIRAQPVLDDNGTILSWLGVNTDINDRKTFAEMLQQRQEETEQQRAELETIYRTAPIGLALFDPVEFRYLRVNDRQVEIIGLPREQILGRRITEIAPLKDIEELFRQVAHGNTIRNHIFEGELTTRPGDRRYWNTNYSPLHGSDGQVEAIAAVIQEITHQKKAEQALVQSEKLAAVGRLASSISHEINNPLEAITNLLYLIKGSAELPPSLADYVNTAQSELARVCQIATQTLRFHRQAVNPTYVTAFDLVEAVLNLYQGRLANSGIRVESGYFTSTPILCLENDIRQVLNNLIANAIDAMRHSGRLVVRAHDSTDMVPGGTGARKGIRITIADTGHGMSSDVRERVFEPFYTTKELNGNGLGLWISHGIVERHHGHLSVRSSQHAIHHGTVFSLFLPCLEAVAVEQEEQHLEVCNNEAAQD